MLGSLGRFPTPAALWHCNPCRRQQLPTSSASLQTLSLSLPLLEGRIDICCVNDTSGKVDRREYNNNNNNKVCGLWFSAGARKEERKKKMGLPP